MRMITAAIFLLAPVLAAQPDNLPPDIEAEERYEGPLGLEFGMSEAEVREHLAGRLELVGVRQHEDSAGRWTGLYEVSPLRVIIAGALISVALILARAAGAKAALSE